MKFGFFIATDNQANRKVVFNSSMDLMLQSLEELLQEVNIF